MAKILPQSLGLAPELPAHVGIIMDGNGRWAKERGLPRPMGHRAGMERLRGSSAFPATWALRPCPSMLFPRKTGSGPPGRSMP